MTRVQAAFLYGNTSKDKIGSELASTQAFAGHPCHPLGMWLRYYFPDPLDKVGGLAHTLSVSSTDAPQMCLRTAPKLPVEVPACTSLSFMCSFLLALSWMPPASPPGHVFYEYERCALFFLQLGLAMVTLLGALSFR